METCVSSFCAIGQPNDPLKLFSHAGGFAVQCGKSDRFRRHHVRLCEKWQKYALFYEFAEGIHIRMAKYISTREARKGSSLHAPAVRAIKAPQERKERKGVMPVAHHQERKL